MRLPLVYSLGGRELKGADGRPEIAKTEIFGCLPKVNLSSAGHAPRISDRIGARKGSFDSSRGSGVACEERSSNGSAAVEISRPQVPTKTWKTVETVFDRTFEFGFGSVVAAAPCAQVEVLFRMSPPVCSEDDRSSRCQRRSE